MIDANGSEPFHCCSAHFHSDLLSKKISANFVMKMCMKIVFFVVGFASAGDYYRK